MISTGFLPILSDKAPQWKIVNSCTSEKTDSTCQISLLSPFSCRTHHSSIVSDLLWILYSPDIQQHLLDEWENTIESDRIGHSDEKQ